MDLLLIWYFNVLTSSINNSASFPFTPFCQPPPFFVKILHRMICIVLFPSFQRTTASLPLLYIFIAKMHI
uniref:Uncharacterized protein n=2 Tax=Meloidogyne TaxID=189290 RepID=A0A6V7W4E1_MELEN|nr:unnamed protein product [Meloidogyne enterolobii]